MKGIDADQFMDRAPFELAKAPANCSNHSRANATLSNCSRVEDNYSQYPTTRLNILIIRGPSELVE